VPVRVGDHLHASAGRASDGTLQVMALTLRSVPFAAGLHALPPDQRAAALGATRPDLLAAVNEVRTDPTALRHWRVEAATEICAYLDRDSLLGVAVSDGRQAVWTALRQYLPKRVAATTNPTTHRYTSTVLNADRPTTEIVSAVCTATIGMLCPATVARWVSQLPAPHRATVRGEICERSVDPVIAGAVLALAADQDDAGLADRVQARGVSRRDTLVAQDAAEFYDGPLPTPLARALIIANVPAHLVQQTPAGTNDPVRALTPDAAHLLLHSGSRQFVSWAVATGVCPDDAVVKVYAGASPDIRLDILACVPSRDLVEQFAVSYEFHEHAYTAYTAADVLHRWPDLSTAARIRLLRGVTSEELVRFISTGFPLWWQPGEVTAVLTDLASRRDSGGGYSACTDVASVALALGRSQRDEEWFTMTPAFREAAEAAVGLARGCVPQLLAMPDTLVGMTALRCIADRCGTDPHAWEIAMSLSGQWKGTVGELGATAQLCATRAAG
jgi:hypothetical protein